MRILLAERWHHGWLAAWFVVALLWLADVTTGLVGPLERAWSDHNQASVSIVPSPDIVLVAIDDASLAAMGPWPWPRDIHAQLIDRLTSAGARLVVHTVPFVGAESQQALVQLDRIARVVTTDPSLADHEQLLGLVQQSQALLDADTALANSVMQNKRTVLAVRGVQAGDAEWPLAQLSAAAMGVGHAFFHPEPDGRFRAHALEVMAGERTVPSLALWVASAWEGRPPNELLRQDGLASLGRLRWPVDSQGRVHVPWRAERSETIGHWSAATVWAGKVGEAQLRGKVVLIGPTTPALALPLLLPDGSTLMPVDALAQTSAALLTQQLVNRPRWAMAWTSGLMALIVGFFALGSRWLAARSALAMAVLWAVLLLTASHLSMTQALIELPVMLPVIALMGGQLAWWLAGRPRPSSTEAPWAASTPSTQEAVLTVHSIALADMPPVPVRPGRQAPTSIAADPVPTAPDELTAPADLPPMPAALTPAGRGHRLPQLGDFQLEHEIGRGAMGRVYLAHSVGTGERVAIKTLALAREFDGFALHEARIRFQREALAALRLRHPDIVQVIDAGEDQGHAWIAMELLHGHDLVRYTQPHNLLPVPDVLEICARVAGALVHAHAQGIVHRDIKPANVMYRADIGGVKVTDFGIARITDAARTRTGLVLGSPSYMSPEHLAGGAVDGRSDLYSLGVLLFQLLTGSLPVQGHSMAELMRAVAHTPAPDVRSLRPRLPEAVANVVALALEKRVELRYADAQQLEADLRTVRGLWERPLLEPAGNGSSHRTVEEVAGVSGHVGGAFRLAELVVHNRSD